MTSALYDALTLEVERADTLAEHLANRLSDLSAGQGQRELYALSIIAQDIRGKHAQIIEKARALESASRIGTRAASKGSAR